MILDMSHQRTMMTERGGPANAHTYGPESFQDTTQRSRTKPSPVHLSVEAQRDPGNESVQDRDKTPQI